MGGNACILKKRVCDPPALATLAIPEQIISDIASGLLDRSLLEKAGLEAFLYRCAALDEQVMEKYKVALDWFYANVSRVEANDKPLPAPWYQHEAEDDKDKDGG